MFRLALKKEKGNKITTIAKLFALHANVINNFETKCTPYQVLVNGSDYFRITFEFVKNRS